VLQAKSGVLFKSKYHIDVVIFSLQILARGNYHYRRLKKFICGSCCFLAIFLENIVQSRYTLNGSKSSYPDKTMSHQTRTIGMIPARYQSSRFPGKPLVLIAGKTLLQHTYENARQSGYFDELIVATDDQRIFNHVIGFDGRVVMTSPDHLTGTDRLTEALVACPDLQDADIVVNVQGDAPCVDFEVFRQLIQLLQADSEAVMSTAVTPISNQSGILDPSVVKCVFDQLGNALYFSRSPIPASFMGTPSTAFQHIGVYAFRPDFLLRYGQLAVTPLQLSESLEQLKVLEHGYRIKIAVIAGESPDVNTPEDILKVESFLLCKQNTSSSLAASVHR